MTSFNIIGHSDPMLEVALAPGESIQAESGAMVTMDHTLDLEGKMSGGLLSSLTRQFVSSESLFLQNISASDKPGKIILAPSLPGSVNTLEVGTEQFRLNDGAFLAAESSVSMDVKAQGIGKALFGGTGGLFVMETSGQGKLAISGFGHIQCLEISPEHGDVIIDNGHVLAWSAGLNYKLSMSTSKKKKSLLSKLWNSATSGEGLSNTFHGTGKVYICSRNTSALVDYIVSRVPRS